MSYRVYLDGIYSTVEVTEEDSSLFYAPDERPISI